MPDSVVVNNMFTPQPHNLIKVCFLAGDCAVVLERLVSSKCLKSLQRAKRKETTNGPDVALQDNEPICTEN